MVTPDSITALLAGGGTLAFGALVLAMSPRSAIHRAFALFCGIRGGMIALQAFSDPTTDLQGRVSVYLLLAVPFAAWWLAHAFIQRDRRGLDLRLAWGLLAGLLVVEALYLYDHDLYYDGPLVLFLPLQFTAFAAIGLAVASMYRGCPPGPGRRALYVLALAFVAEPTFWVAYNLWDYVLTADAGLVDAALAAPAAATAAIVLATAWRMARLHASPEDRHDRWRFLFVLGLAAASGAGLFATVVVAPGVWGDVHPFLIGNALWTLFLPAATAYAIVRYRLFTIDLRVKMFIRYGSVALVEGIIFVMLSDWLENRVASRGVVSALAALGVAAFLFPMSRGARRMADRLMPGVSDDDAYRAVRRKEIFRAALERAWLDGHLSPEERLALDTLWKSLGISGKEARELEQQVRPRGPQAV